MSSQLKIRRVAVIDPGAFGVLLWNGLPFALSLERTYTKEDGTQSIKIPPGAYRCTKTRYIRGGYDTFEIAVPGRTRILFHKANKESDLDGCVGIGEEFGELNGLPAIIQSGAGFAEFMRKTAGLDEFEALFE